jgi:hypothetical protein
MPLRILDPRTGTRVTFPVVTRQTGEQRARRWVVRELDRLAEQRHPTAKCPIDMPTPYFGGETDSMGPTFGRP